MKRVLIALFVLSALPVFAQENKVEPNYELAERFSAPRISKMVHSTKVRANWFENSPKFWYKWDDSNGTKYYLVDPVAKSKTEIFDMDKLAMELTTIVKDPYDAQHIPIEKLELVDDSKFVFEIRSTEMVEKKDDKKKGDKDGKKEGNKPAKERKVFRFEYDLATKQLKDITEVEEEKDTPRWASVSPDGNKAIYLKNYNIWMMDKENLAKAIEDEKDSTIVETQLTFDGEYGYSYGLGNYRNEKVKDTLKRSRTSVYWSPDSKHFATIRSDLRNLQELWVINSVAKPRPTLESYQYQMPGEDGPTDYLYLFNVEDKSSKIIKTNRFKDQELSLEMPSLTQKDTYAKPFKIKWLGDNSGFYFNRRSRDLKRFDVCWASVESDTCKAVIEERLNTYIENRSIQVTSDGKEIIQWSERNGWAHLYLYSNDGTLKNAITTGAYHVEDVVKIDEAARKIYFIANGVNKAENPYYTHLYSINFDGSGMKQLDSFDYDYEVSGCDNGKYFVLNYSRVDTTPKSMLIDNNGRKIMDLETADLSQLFAAGYKFPEIFKVKAADGITDLYGVMYKPFDFDSTKSYPLIEYVYPGPQTEANNSSWSANMTRIDRLAQIGFVVITVGNRGGHPNRSKWYHNYGYGNLRDYGLADKKYAAQQIAARYSFIDGDKIGIHGHSGGGFMSTAAILKYPDFFKVAVSCAGNHDNSIYNRWWSEQHHGILEEVTAAGDTIFKYNIDKNQDIAKNLKGHLLLVTGDIDNNVHPANTIRVVDALIRANKRFDMLILPGQRHGFGDMNEYFFWRMADYYSEHLLGKSEKSVDIVQLNNDK